MRSTVFDALVVFEMFLRLTQPWTSTPAFKAGIIDAQGNVLRSYRTLKTPQERVAYSILDRFVFSIRRMIAKLPGGTTRIASVMAALWLVREPKPLHEADLSRLLRSPEWRTLAEQFGLKHGVLLLESETPNMEEDAAANSAGGGGVAGIGQPPGTHFGEPAVPRKRQQFAGAELFEVDSDRYAKCLQGKKKFLQYQTYAGSDEIGEDIRQYARENPGKPIVLQDRTTGSMSYLRYGRDNPARGLSVHGY